MWFWCCVWSESEPSRKDLSRCQTVSDNEWLNDDADGAPGSEGRDEIDVGLRNEIKYDLYDVGCESQCDRTTAASLSDEDNDPCSVPTDTEWISRSGVDKGSDTALDESESGRGMTRTYGSYVSKGSSGSMNSDASSFEGRWCLKRVEGDVDSFMAETGTRWALRKLAKHLNYGVGQSEQEVRVTDDALMITNKVGPRVATSTIPLTGEEKLTVGPDGSACLVSSTWNGSVMQIQSRKQCGRSLPATARFFDGEDLVVENRTANGTIVRRIYAKILSRYSVDVVP